ncbi:MAG: RNA methyltransferase [Micrococcales bacterium]|nr:RNA methyltransferase [Micrococcales bacterium]
MIIPISDPSDPRLDPYLRLKDVRLRRQVEPEQGLFMAESAEVIKRALDAGIEPISMLMSSKWLTNLSGLIGGLDQAVPIYVGEEALLQQITGFHMHRGAIAAMRRPNLPSLDAVMADAKRLVIIEDLVDHTNLGAIFRAAAGLSVDAVLVTPHSADPLYRRSVRVSMGTVFQVPWTRIDPWPGALELLRQAGFTIGAMALTDQAVNLDDFAKNLPDRLALMVGAEGDGLTAHALSEADVVIQIAMSGGVDSLNVAAAAAVAFWATRPKPGAQAY